LASGTVRDLVAGSGIGFTIRGRRRLLASPSTNSRQIFDYDVRRQYIQLDDPQVTLKAIRETLDAMPKRHVSQR
jgi:hypothetical protein